MKNTFDHFKKSEKEGVYLIYTLQIVMIKINDSTYVIIGTLSLLVGGTFVFNIGPPTTLFQSFIYWIGVSLIVSGIFLDAGIVVKTQRRIEYEKLQSIIRDLENQIRIIELEIRIKKIECESDAN